jgi:heme oxygenase
MEDFSLSAIMGRMATSTTMTVGGDDVTSTDDDGDEGEGTAGESFTSSFTSSSRNDNDVPSDANGTLDEYTPPHQEEAGGGGGRSSLLSYALKTGTAASHSAAENVHFVRDFINGKIDRESYKFLVTGLYHSYVALEGLLDAHAPKRFPTLHFPTELGRARALGEDMDYWHGPDWSSRTSSTSGDLRPSPAVSDYVNRMIEVGGHDPLLLLSHAYTRYLGDLSGGKILSRIARRALNLGKAGDADGLRFYEFDMIPSAKRFKDEYRRLLDELPLTNDEIRRLVAEANVAFALNMRVFEELDVMGGVPGARVRNVREALSYYDIETDGRGGDDDTGGGGGGEEEAKCPFGFVGGGGGGGGRPEYSHRGASSSDGSKDAPGGRSSRVGSKAGDDVPPPGGGGTTLLRVGGRCPWPFVFLHDPATGLRDWQTWFVIGLAMCWLWSLRVSVDPFMNDVIED